MKKSVYFLGIRLLVLWRCLVFPRESLSVSWKFLVGSRISFLLLSNKIVLCVLYFCLFFFFCRTILYFRGMCLFFKLDYLYVLGMSSLFKQILAIPGNSLLSWWDSLYVLGIVLCDITCIDSNFVLLFNGIPFITQSWWTKTSTCLIEICNFALLQCIDMPATCSGIQ